MSNRKQTVISEIEKVFRLNRLKKNDREGDAFTLTLEDLHCSSGSHGTLTTISNNGFTFVVKDNDTFEGLQKP